MKIRFDFVTNSSSSQFMVYTKTSLSEELEDKIERHGYFVNLARQAVGSIMEEYVDLGGVKQKYYTLDLDSFAQTEFGWECVEYKNFWDKLSWSVLQIRHTHQQSDADELESKLIEVANEVMCELDPQIRIDSFKNEGYIDHQSVGFEELRQAFKNMDSLRAWLLDETNYVQGDNDNH